MGLVARELAFPAILFPCFVVLAILLACLLRKDLPDLPRRYRDILMASWWMALTALAAGAASYSLQKKIEHNQVSIEADMEVSRGILVELYLNDFNREPYRQQVIEGQRYTYRFDKLPQEITLLRLDPTEHNGAQIVIYGIAVKAGDRIVRNYGPEDLKSWMQMNLSPPNYQSGGLGFVSTTNDPILKTSPALRLPGATLAKWSAFIDDSNGPFVLVAAAFLLTLLARAGTFEGRLEAALIAVASCVGIPVLWAARHLDLLPPPVTRVVGYASYYGYSKTNEILAGVVTLLICAGLAFGCAKWIGRKQEDGDGEEFASGKQKRTWIAHTAVFAFVFLYFLPDLSRVLENLRQMVYRSDSWDFSNTLLWTSLIHKGLRPYIDFWYPYGAFYIQLMRFPIGTMSIVVHSAVIAWCFYLGLFQVTGRRLGQSLTVFAVVLIPMVLEMMIGWHRYLMPADVLLFYAAICDAPRLSWKTHLPFAALAGYVCFGEPPQIICAACAIAVHSGLAMISHASGAWQVLRQRLICVGIPMGAGITGSVLIYAANGMLPGLWDFEKSVSDVGDYSAVPADMGGWLLPALQPATIFLLLFLLTTYAIYRWARMKGKHDPLGTALLTICVSGFVAMQKQIVRPHIMEQWRVYPYVAAVILGLILWRERKPAAGMAMMVFVGGVIGIGVRLDFLAHIYHSDFKDAPGNLTAAAKVMFGERKEVDEINESLYARSRFAAFTAQKAVVDNLTQDCGLHPQDNVFVLGDDLIFYLLLNQAPPYSSNTYNESPIYEQQKVLDWLQKKDPRFVIWGEGTGPEKQVFDLVPHTVRLPLIYSYVVDHYKFLRAVGPFHILSKMPPNDSPDLAYWRKTLGDSIELRRVPWRARLADYDSCKGDQASCDAVLVVRYPAPAPVPQGKLNVTVQSSGDTFLIRLDVLPGQREYVVNLSRMWFWKPLARSGTPQVVVEDERARGFLGYHRGPNAVLY